MSIAKPFSALEALLPFGVRHSLAGIPGAIVAASFCANVTSLVLPLVVMQIYDRVIPNQTIGTMMALAVMAAGVILFEAIIRLIRSYLMARAACRQAWTTYSDAIGRIMAAPPQWWASESPSRVADRFRSLTAVSEWQASSARHVLLDLPFVALYFLLLAIIGGPLVLVPLAVLATLGAFVGRESGKLQKLRADLVAAEMRLHDFLVDCFSSMQAIKGNALEQQMARRHERLQAAVGAGTADCSRVSEQLRGCSDLVSQVTIALILGVGALLVISNELSVGALACCSMLCGRAVQPVLRCLGMWAELQSLAIDHENGRVLARLPAARGRPAKSDARLPAPAGIELRGVTTPDSMPITPPLRNADLTIAAGSIVAVLGTAGPGTNALAALLTGRISPVAGQVSLRSHAMSTGPTLAGTIRVGRMVGSTARDPVVLMASVLDKPFDASLIENMDGFGCSCSVREACDAASLIGLDDEIDMLPAGFETPMASGTVPSHLLVRISVARAIASQPGILVLDHVNEGLDSVAEQRMAQGLRTLKGKMTILILTNRPSFASNADVVLSLADGKFVVKSGAPSDAF